MRQQLLKLLARVSTLVWLGLLEDVRFLARAGIASGDLRIKTLVAPGGAREIRIGSAMVRAFELERTQAWVGGAIGSSLRCDDETLRWTVNYPVPFAEGYRSSDRPLALNWLCSGKPLHQLARELRETSAEIGPSDGADEKLVNTLRFVEHVYETGQFAPCSLEP
jgi:hypothetical protein